MISDHPNLEQSEDVFIFPASFAQQRLWFIDQLLPDASLYSVPLIFRLTGDLARSQLHRSLQTIVQRHEILRTTFEQVDGQLVQVVAPNLFIPLELTDLRSVSDDSRETVAFEQIWQEVEQPFHLERGALLRSRLWQLQDTEHLLLIALHHIIFDEWSSGVLIRELGECYTAMVEARSLQLPELPIQYADFAHWQREWLQGEVLNKQLHYWKHQLKEVPVLNLSSSRLREQSHQGASQLLEFPQSLLDALEALSQQAGVTLFMTLLAAFQTLLHRYTGETDIAIGSPVANRHQSELEGLIGFFVNSLVMRTDLAGDPTFRALLDRVREVTLSAYAHQDLPFEKLVEELQPVRSLGQNPLFQVVFALQNTPMEQLVLPSLVLSPVELETKTARFSLELYLWKCADNFRNLWGRDWQHSDGLRGVIVYNTELFDSSAIASLRQHFQTLLTGIVANPEARLSELPLLTIQEQQALLQQWSSEEAKSLFEINRSLHQPAPEWNSGLTVRSPASGTKSLSTPIFQSPLVDFAPSAPNSIPGRVSTEDEKIPFTSEPFPHDSNKTFFNAQTVCIHQLFEAQVSNNPSAIAVQFADQSFTYEALNQGSNQLARYLQRFGIDAETPVGICLDRGIEAIASMLAVLKAGGAYVPLDPSYPQERLQFMLKDAGIRIVLTQANYAALVQTDTVICLEQEWNTIAQEPDQNLSTVCTADQLAYVIYTSGSTGTPKGVMVTHRGVNRLVCDPNYIEIKLNDRVAQVASLTFDAATFEVWGALLNGAQLIGLDRETTLSPSDFANQLQQQKISILFLTTALLNQTIRHIPTAFQSLKYLLFGGERATVETVRSLLQHGKPQHLIHVYGPTENTTFSTWYEVQTVSESTTMIPIGQAVTKTQVYLLDALFNPVPAGVSGEIYLGGDGLARGYLNQPELTAEKFIQAHNLRLYRTGDRALYRSDGNLEFLGRMDNQVKLRGFRVELGEIETVLTQHPKVQSAIVILREQDDRQLIAYIVASEKLTESELRSFLKPKLPVYMLPAAFVRLDSLPLTANGKVNQKALPAPSLNRSEHFPLPTTSSEATLSEIWMQLLGRRQISIQDNFFELGGHSLLATQLVSRIRDRFQVELPLRAIFETPTIAELAQIIEGSRHREEIEL